MASGDVNANDRFLDRWRLQAYPRLSPVNDLALRSRLSFHVQCYALPGDHRLAGTWWYLARTFLHLRFYWLLLLQSVSLLICWLVTKVLSLPPPDFLPNYLFTALSSFSWVCWIAPDNVKLNQFFGVTHGLAMGVFTFDWGQISGFNGSPLVNPWWSAANVGIAVLFFTWFLVPVLYVGGIYYLYLSVL